ncbi:short-chain dehydrogenase [Cylindrobasidium torrendii FP15055 ss-10]|uniref:Short-chain dehydrogenase n=1 Tax=Cylindrobasidium torrendii FP15055 ss-10 TaxID=1314674 RepID=A0A0D7B932_9AGAR|nr:short-chain dehydrogenase [Cylindrobasidium torrendii FP15055 ss-10]
MSTSTSSTLPLQNQIALVTGAGTGIGLMIAQSLAKAGTKVYITGRRLNVLENAVAESNITNAGTLIPLQMDACSESDIARAVQTIRQADGKLDILVNNAGFNGSKSDPDGFNARKAAVSAADNMDPETVQDWLDLFHINSIMPFFIIRAFTPLLKEGAEARGPQATSNIINITSTTTTMAFTGTYGSLAYTATKAALENISSVMAVHFARNGPRIRVNCIAPGLFPSELAERTLGKAGLDEIAKQAVPGYMSASPAGRGGRPEEIGATTVYLASNEFVNGVSLKVDGGLSMMNP